MYLGSHLQACQYKNLTKEDNICDYMLVPLSRWELRSSETLRGE